MLLVLAPGQIELVRCVVAVELIGLGVVQGFDRKSDRLIKWPGLHLVAVLVGVRKGWVDCEIY